MGRTNNDTSFAASSTEAEFMLTQRNAGFADNDGKWCLSQLADLYWSPGGVLRQRRAGVFIGVFETEVDARAAAEVAPLQPVDDRMVGF